MCERILIIGGTGNISGAIVRVLASAGHDVTVFTRGRADRPLPDGIRRLRGDRRDRDAFEELMRAQRFDAVIDMICYSADDALSDLRAFRDVRHLIHTSTVATFGGPLAQAPADELTPERPVSAYGRGKVAADRVFRGAFDDLEYPVTIVKPASTWGPGMNVIRQLGFDAKWLHRVMTGRPILIADGGRRLWSLCHSHDAAHAYQGLLFKPWSFGETYIVTAPEPITWKRYHEQVASALGSTADLVSAPAPTLMEAWPEGTALLVEQTRWDQCYDVGKLTRALPGWRASITLSDRIADNVAWMESTGRLDRTRSPREDEIIAAVRRLGATLTPERDDG